METIEPLWGSFGNFRIDLKSTCVGKGVMTNHVSRLILFVHSITWGRMLARKVCDSQRPINIILLGECFARNKPMAAPNRIDFVLMSILSNPKASFPPSVAQVYQS